MLVLTRKSNESLMIGENVEVVVLQIKGNNVKLGIKAPRDYSVYRREIYDQIKEQNRMASMAAPKELDALENLMPQTGKGQIKKKIKFK